MQVITLICAQKRKEMQVASRAIMKSSFIQQFYERNQEIDDLVEILDASGHNQNRQIQSSGTGQDVDKYSLRRMNLDGVQFISYFDTICQT